jgi:NAD+ kinase
VVGVNNGRLGFLAEFDLASLEAHAPSIFGPSPLVRHRMLLEVRVVARDGSLSASHVAMNDAVVTAGPPYHMIELRLGLNGEDGPVIDGDGCIVSTPVGSTAYNASAGGPVVHPDTEVLIVTPEAAHSLAFRPVVVPSHTDVRLDLMRANPGTSLLCDGIPVESLKVGDTVVVSRHHHMARLIANPDCSYLHTLSQKLRWAAPPDYRG